MTIYVVQNAQKMPIWKQRIIECRSSGMSVKEWCKERGLILIYPTPVLFFLKRIGYMLLSLEWRFSRGRFITPAFLGYDRVEVPDGHGSHKKELQINEDEAQTVRLMYYMLLNGSSITEIASTLTELERETGQRKVNGKPNTRWSEGGVYNVLRNERYCGDVLARETWTPNSHDHKSKRNNGKKNKYYQPGHHEAIITRAQWNAAQRILNSHRFRHTGGYLPMAVIDHGAMTGFISINRFWAG